MTLSLDFLALPLLGAAALVFISVLAGVLSARVGFSFLLVFLTVGVLAGEEGPGGFAFDDFRLSFWVGNVALAVILLDGGLRTDLHSRVLDAGDAPIPGLYCVGEAAGFGGGGSNGRRSLEGTFLPGCILTARAAARHLVAG